MLNQPPYKDLHRGAVQRMVAAARAAGAVPVALLAANYDVFAHIFTRHSRDDANKQWMFDGGQWSVQHTWNTMFDGARQMWLEEGALVIDASGLYAHGELRAPGGDGWHFSTPAARQLAIWSLDEAVRLGLAWAEPGRGWGLLVPERPELLQVAVPAEDPWYGFPEQARRVPGAGASPEPEVPLRISPLEFRKHLGWGGSKTRVCAVQGLRSMFAARRTPARRKRPEAGPSGFRMSLMKSARGRP